MRATTVAIAAAGLAGAAHAATEGWDNIYTSSDVEPIATTAVYETTEEPVVSSTYEAPVSSSTESPIVSSSEIPVYGTSSEVEPTATTTASAVPTSADEWGHWSETTSSASKTTTTASAVTTTTTTKAAVTTTTTKSVPTGGESVTWAPVYETSSGVVYESTTTLTSTITKTVTVWPTETATTWAQWSSTSAGWSSEGWWGNAWPTKAPGQCVMNVVTGYGDATWAPNPPTKPTASYSSAPAPAYTTGAAQFYGSSSAAPSYGATPSSKPSGGHGISSNGNQWGMTYSPYTADSGCKDQGTISNDIATLARKGFTSVRVYSTDCNTLEYVGQAAKENNVKMILGVFISNTGVVGAAPQVAQIVAWGQWDLVELIVVGNEAIFNGFTNADELAGFIGTAKAAFTTGGYTGPVTTTEDLATWTSVGSKFCGVVDVVAANLYAYFNPDTTADKAGDLISAQVEELGTVCGDLDTYIMESGWPSAGGCNGMACAGKDEQATAIKSIQATNGAKVIFFSYEDELWKAAGEYGVEQHWGCADVFPG